MKRKLYLVGFVLVIAGLLAGCSGVGIVTPANDEAAVRSVIQEFFLAINDQNWSKAKSYCINGSDAYYTVSVIEDGMNMIEQYYGVNTMITCFTNISNVSVNGSYAIAYIDVTIIMTTGFYYESEDVSGYFYLQKIGSSWKLY